MRARRLPKPGSIFQLARGFRGAGIPSGRTRQGQPHLRVGPNQTIGTLYGALVAIKGKSLRNGLRPPINGHCLAANQN
jgi:hypothetical protein